MSRQYMATAAECCAVYSSLLSSSTTIAAARPMFISRYWSLSSVWRATCSFSRTSSLNMYWAAKSGTKRRVTAMMPAAAYSAAIARPKTRRTASDRRNGGISSRQKARNSRWYFTRIPTLRSARLVASKTTAATAAARSRPTVI